MKKIALLIGAVLFVAGASRAGIKTWTSQIISSGLSDPNASGDPQVQSLHPTPLSDGDGADWLIRILDAAAAVDVAGSVSDIGPIFYSSSDDNFGWASAVNSLVLGGFDFDAPEGQEVKMVVYGKDAGPVGTFSFIVSAPEILNPWSDPPGVDDAKVTFNFAGSEWQAIPEPTGAALVLAGLAVVAIRRMKARVG